MLLGSTVVLPLSFMAFWARERELFLFFVLEFPFLHQGWSFQATIGPSSSTTPNCTQKILGKVTKRGAVVISRGGEVGVQASSGCRIE